MLSVVMLMLAQEITGPPGDQPMPVLTTLTRPRNCVAQPGDDIVVCGVGADSQRVQPLPPWSSEPAIKPAGVRLSPNSTITATAEQGNNPFSKGPRAMINFKLDF